MRKVLIGCVLISLSTTLTAATRESHAKRIAEAASVLRELRAAPDKGISDELFEKASCVAVIPSVKKAAFIVKAVNAHDALVEALKPFAYCRLSNCGVCANCAARAALALVADEEKQNA